MSVNQRPPGLHAVAVLALAVLALAGGCSARNPSLSAQASATRQGAAAPPAHEVPVTLDLGGTQWTVYNRSVASTPGKPVPAAPAVAATVPGQVHTDLLAASVIGEPFEGSNPDQLRWVALSNWTYQRSFEVPTAMLGKRVVQLVSLGVDTVADIYINDHHVAFTDNMFHTLRLDTKAALREGTNTIRVDFVSKVTEAQRRADACRVNSSVICPLRIPNACQHGFNNANYLRTEPCSFSWDWGPGFAPVGLWRPIYLQAYDTAVVRDITVSATPRPATDPAAPEPARGNCSAEAGSDGARECIAHALRRTDGGLDLGAWDAEVVVFLDAGVADNRRGRGGTSESAAAVAGSVAVSLAGRTFTQPATVQPGAEACITVPAKGLSGIETWMPNGFGPQNLYTVSAVFTPTAPAASGSAPMAPFTVPYPLEDNAIKGANGSLSVRFGFRQIELVQAPLPGGKSYYFRVNGVPIPVKGSNWIPADAFESRVSRNTNGTTRLEPLFQALQNSHQNMIRNWGGGIYQRDSFYDLADEAGIMIWEDLMFACSEYAVPGPFLVSAAKEIQDNVRRLQAHPSIALWAGNNEDERDMKGASDDPSNPANPAHIKAYSLLTFVTGLANITAIDRSRPLSGSSPSDGNETAEHPFSWDHQSEFYGDVHSYLYGADNWDETVFKRPRFMSEFGLQSWPSAVTMARVFPADQWSYDSALSVNRNHHPNGQAEILEQIGMHFHLPAPCQGTTPACYYSAWSQMLWMTQLNQALGYKIEVEQFRRIRTECSETVAGCNMGRMFWQTNDVWQGASWAAIDYTGRYKMVQYFSQRFYAPFLVSLFGTAEHSRFGAHIVNDRTEPGDRVAGEIRFTMHTWADGPVGTWTLPFVSEPASATAVTNSTFEAMLARGGCPGLDATLCFLTADAFNGTAAAGTLLSSNYLLLAPFYSVRTMRQPNLEVQSVVKQSPKPGATHEAFDVAITSQAAAAFVWAETPYHGHWSDNGVLLHDWSQPLQLTFFSPTSLNGALTADQVKASLRGGRWVQPGGGGVWSLVDTDPNDYTAGLPGP